MNTSFQILSFKGIAGGPNYLINKDGNFDPDKGSSPKNRTLQTMLELSSNVFTRGYVISSVKRPLDGKIFSIGSEATGYSKKITNPAFQINSTIKIFRIDMVNGTPHFNIGQDKNFSIFDAV